MSVTFGAAFGDLQARLGKDPAVTMSAPLPALYALALSDGVRVGWEAEFWPKVVLFEERTPSAETEGYGLIAWEQAGETAIAAVEVNRCLYERDPRVYTRQAPLKGVFTSRAGIVVPDTTTATTLFVRFRPPAPEYAATDTLEDFPAFLRRFAVLHAAAELLSDDQARYRTRAAAEDEMERLRGVEIDAVGERGKAER